MTKKERDFKNVRDSDLIPEDLKGTYMEDYERLEEQLKKDVSNEKELIQSLFYQRITRNLPVLFTLDEIKNRI